MAAVAGELPSPLAPMLDAWDAHVVVWHCLARLPLQAGCPTVWCPPRLAEKCSTRSHGHALVAWMDMCT